MDYQSEEIEVKNISGDIYQVIVTGDTKTEHTVTMDDEYYFSLSDGKVSQLEFIKLSFEFLLERESSTEILSSFDIKIISKYFRGYEEEIGKMIKYGRT